MTFHFALAHFPIALLVTGGLLLIAGFIRPTAQKLQDTALTLLVGGALFALPTLGSGMWLAEEHLGHDDALSTHRLLAFAATATAIVGALSHWLRARITNADIVRNLFFIASMALAGATGYSGGEMSHGQGGHEHREHATVDHADEGDHGAGADDGHHDHAPAHPAVNGKTNDAGDAATIPITPQPAGSQNTTPTTDAAQNHDGHNHTH